MSEEIKEILEHIKTYPEKLYCLSEKEKRILLDYITILQQKVEQLENIINEAKEKCKSVIEDPEHTTVSEFNISGLMRIILNILNKGSKQGVNMEGYLALIKEQREENDKLQQKLEKLEKENNDLRRIYQNTYKKYLESGNDEMARYFMAQIDACPTFYVAPIIDYYKEYNKLENIRKETIEYVKKQLNNIMAYERTTLKNVLNMLDEGKADVTAN